MVTSVLLVGCSAPDPREQLPPQSNVLLITIDTLRADHLSAYGYPRETSPTLDRLAAEGIRFDRPAVQWPKTGPSFASIFTSTYGKDNGIVRRIGIPLPDEYTMLAEVLSDRGFDTAAVVANGAVASEFNFNQGFNTYVMTWKIEGVEGDPNRAERVTDEALALAENLEEPFFLWVHYLDPHHPYSPPEGFADRFVGDEYYDPSIKINIDWSSRRRQMAGIGRELVLEGSDELDFYKARYDEEILYTDFGDRPVARGTRRQRLLDQTLIAVTSDHGESLGDHHYYFDHGRFSFQTCLRVPFILHYPGVLEPRVDYEPAQLLDLSPTILEFAGLELEQGAWAQGKSMVPRLFRAEDGDAPERLAFSEAGYGMNGNWQRIVQDDRYKLILIRATADQRWFDAKGEKWVLYDLVEDPDETTNLVRDLPEDSRRLQKALVSWLNAEKFPMGASAEMVEGEMDAETRKQLEALGYLQ